MKPLTTRNSRRKNMLMPHTLLNFLQSKAVSWHRAIIFVTFGLLCAFYGLYRYNPSRDPVFRTNQHYLERYPAFGKACFRKKGPNHGGFTVPEPADASLFNDLEAVALVVSCAHINRHKFNPYHWSMGMWHLINALTIKSENVREVVVPCASEDFNLDDMDSNTWVATYWTAILSLLEKYKIPLRFTGSDDFCISNAAFLHQEAVLFGDPEQTERIRQVAYNTCKIKPAEEPSAVNSIAILTRPGRRSFSSREMSSFTALAEKNGFAVREYSIPKDYCDQVRFFSSGNYKFLITPHGAQMTNGIFLPPGTVVLEFFPPDFRIQMYCSIKYSTPIQWLEIYREGSKVEISDTCAPTEPGLCQRIRLCRAFLKIRSVRLYDPQSVLDLLKARLAKADLNASDAGEAEGDEGKKKSGRGRPFKFFGGVY